MPSTNTFLGLGAVFSVIYTFYTSTLGVIYGQMWTNYNAMIYMIGFGAILFVAVWPLFTRSRLRDVHGRNFLAVLIVTLLVIPYVVQGQYNPTDLTLYSGVDDVTGFDRPIAQIESSGAYYNTSSSWIAFGLTEAQVSNGTWTNTLTATSQDTDKRAQLSLVFGAVATTVDEYINHTAWLSANDEYITGMSIRITAGTLALPVNYEIGFYGASATPLGTWKEGVVYTSDTVDSMIYFDTSDYAEVKEYATFLVNKPFQVLFYELSPEVLINAAEVEVEIHFYSTVSTDDFDTYMLYAGLIMGGMALAMTRHWNPTRRRGFW